MRFFWQLLLVAFIAVAGGAVGAKLAGAPGQGAAAHETALERVVRTNTLHCGYYVFPPFVIRDPATGKMSGFSVDMMDYLTQKSGLKVEWSEEVSFGNWAPALQAKRFDAVCAPMWPDVAFGRVAKFTRSMMYAGIYPIVRIDETRFGGGVEPINDPAVTVIVQEGNMTESLARAVFPKATIRALPQSMDYASLLQEVVEHKADVVLWDRNGLLQYEKNNPGKVRMLALPRPLETIPFELPVLQGESDLRDFLDGLIENMQNTGVLERLIEKWEGGDGIYLRVADPYRS